MAHESVSRVLGLQHLLIQPATIGPVSAVFTRVLPCWPSFCARHGGSFFFFSLLCRPAGRSCFFVPRGWYKFCSYLVPCPCLIRALLCSPRPRMDTDQTKEYQITSTRPQNQSMGYTHRAEAKQSHSVGMSGNDKADIAATKVSTP